MAPDTADFEDLLWGELPSLGFIEEIVRYVAPEELQKWQELWRIGDEVRETQRPPGNVSLPVPHRPLS